MSLSILNSVSSLVAENSLNQTAVGLQKALLQLSTGLKINSSADDAAGLDIASGLQANVAALVQSYTNANNGVSFLQVADGALAQVTTLLNRAVTLATESASSGLTSQQRDAVNTEYQSILSEIDQIGSATQFNGTQVFTDGNSSQISLASNGTALTGTIAPGDTLSGSLTLTTTVPGDPGVTQNVAAQDYGWISIGTITPGAALTGGLTVNSITSGSSAVTSAVNVVNNGDGTIFIPINNSTDTLSGTLTLSTVVPGTSGAAQDISLVNNGSGTLIGSINPADTLSGSLSVTSTTSATGGVQSAMSLTSGGGGTTITGTIPPADSLGGSLTVTSTIPQSGGVSSAVTLANGASITGNVANGNTLTGSVTFTSTTAASGGVSSGVTLTNNGATITGHITSGDTVSGTITVTSTIPKPQTPTFSASGSGSSEAITSSVITAGVPLAGTLLINSTYVDSSGIGTATGTVNLANYQNLSSSDAFTASAAANQLAYDLTSSLGAKTGDSYTATISGGVLTIKPWTPWDSASTEVQMCYSSPTQSYTTPWVTTGSVLSGPMSFFFQPDNGGGSRRSTISLDSANYQGLTSSNSIAAADALSRLNKDIAAQCVSGTQIVVTLDSNKNLLFTTNETGSMSPFSGLTMTYNTGEQMSVGSGNVAFTVSGSGTSQVITSSAIATGTTLSGTLVVNSTGTAKTDGQIPSATLNLSNYGGLSSSNAATASAAATQLAADLTTALKPSTGSTYTATMSGGVLTINSGNAGSSQSLDFISSGGGKILTSANPLVAGATLGGNFKILADGTSFNLSFNKYAGLTSLDASTRNQALQKLSQDITMFTWVDTTASINSKGDLVLTVGGSDTISDSGNEFQTLAGQTAGEQLSLGSQSAQETFNNLPVITPTTITLSNVATANLQSTLQSQLGSNYRVIYSAGTGGLNISISSAGSSAGITTIAESSNALQQKTPVVNPVSTPTVVNLNGVTSANLLSTLQSALSSSIYSVSYNSSTGALTVSETGAALAAGTTITSTTNNLQQTTPTVAAQVTPVTVNLNGVSTANLQSKLSTALGSNYTVGYNTSTGALSIAISATGTANGVKSIAFSGSPTQTTPIVGGTSVTKNVDLTGVTSSNLLATLQNDLGSSYNVTYDTTSGALNISAKVAGTTLTANNGNAQQTGPGTPEVDTPTNIDLTGQTGASLASYLSNQLPWWNYTVTQDANGVTVSPQWWDQMVYGIQSVKATNVQAYETTPAVPPTTTPTNINLTGVATSDLQQTIQNALGSDYGVFYDTGGGFLEIYLNWGNQDGVSSFSTSSTVQQNTGRVAPVSTSSTINLTGVSTTNLASSIVSQLGSAASNYNVSYDTNSGALNIALSTTGATSGIQSITANTSGFIETAPAGTTGLSAMNIFTSDGTTNGSTSLDVTVGSLTTANLGKSSATTGVNLASTNLNSQAGAASALNLIAAAVDGISSQRGTVGANINRLLATANNIGTEQINLTSASNSILNADIGKTIANMTQYNILQSTGMAAMQQSNQAQQAVLKLLQ